MPRQMPRLDLAFGAQAQSALAIARAGEVARINGGAGVRSELTEARLIFLYEVAFLRVFAAWEICQEEYFIRGLCGFTIGGHQEVPSSGAYTPTLAAAQATVLQGRPFILWHNPTKVIARCQSFFQPVGPCALENALNGNLSRLEQIAIIRHRVVHDQHDAKKNFDNASAGLTGRTYPASRPGRLLRDHVPGSAPQQRWLSALVDDLQIAVGRIV